MLFRSPASFGGHTPGYQTPGYETPGYPPVAGQTPGCATPQFNDTNTSYPYHNTTGNGGPMYHPHPTPDYTAATPTPSQAGHQPAYQSPLGQAGTAPVLPGAGAGADFTDAWVSQAANVTATEDWDDMRPDSGMSGGRYSEDEDDNQEEEDAEYQDQETVEQFEDRVLNKRAAKVN